MDEETKAKAQEQLDRANRLAAMSAGVSVLGTLAQGVSSYRTASQRAAVYQMDAAAIRAAIPYERAEADATVQAIRQDTANLISQQRAALAANGIVVDQDSALEAMVGAAGQGAKDVVLALQASQQRVDQLRNTAAQKEFQAKVEKRAGTASVLGSVGGAGLTILKAVDAIRQNNKTYGG